MLFNSLSYAIFLPAVFALYWLLPHTFRWILLLIASYYFYMSWNLRYVVLILGTTAVSYAAGLLLEKASSPTKKKWILAASAIACLGVLFVFKYFNFASQSLCALLNACAIPVQPVTLKFLLPVGISFYTFQTLSYVIDVYRGDIAAEKHFGYYATFISFFPQLVAGPIERTSNLLPQIRQEKHFRYDQAAYGMRLMLIGYLKKIVIADTLAQLVDQAYANITAYSGFSLVLVTLFFTMQIYCDFSGYSDIAIGSAKLLGIDLMTNFKSPYFSASVKEFWSRWHISLSTWFRDYVYIPLGGNRVSALRHKLNLMVTFLVSGLWHGADWTYVLWGAVHGLAQLFAKKKLDAQETPALRLLKIAGTFLFCNLAWVLFRAQTLSDAIHVYTHFFTGLGNGIFGYLYSGFVMLGCGKDVLVGLVISIGIILAVDWWALRCDPYNAIAKMPLAGRWCLYTLVTLTILFFMSVEKNTQFIYFQF